MPSDPVPKSASPSDPTQADQEQANAGDPLGDQDVRFDLRLTVVGASGTLASDSAAAVIRVGLDPTSRGRVVGQVEAAWQKLIEGVAVQLTELKPDG